MRHYFIYTLKQLLFWMLYFLVLQATFILFFYGEVKDVPLSHILYTFRSGLGLNLSAGTYCTIIPVLLVFASSIVKSNASKLTLWVTTFLLCCCFLIYSIDLALYHNWGTRINGKALWYLQFPGTVSASAGSIGHLKFIITVLLVSILFWVCYKRYFSRTPFVKKRPFNLSISFLIIISFLFISLRGGISGRPIGKGQSYYSKYPVLNYAAINGFWNFFDIVSHYKSQGNPYKFFTKVQSETFQNEFSQTYFKNALKISSVERPNLLFVYLESWGADVVGCLGGQPNVTPGFDALSVDGLLFKNFYSTGFRTEQGLMASLSGFPAQAQAYPMEDMDRFENYPNLIRDLSSAGFYTSYFTGGNPQFANTDVYLQSAGIDKINMELLAKAKRKSAWGALDEETFDWVLNSLTNQPVPFFSTMVTLTSHEWFEAPVTKIFTEKDIVATNYKNTVHYTDSCLLDFIGKAKKQKWYKNTLIVIMADHACNYPLNRRMNDPERYHIPMMITGGALKEEFKGAVNSNYCGHLNIPSLVCNELNLSPQKFKLSSNIFSENSFAYFTYDHGVGVLTKKNDVVYDINLKDVIRTKNKSDSLLKLGKFIMQSSAQMKEDYQIMK
jgi:phosphoglycerol transferase MdoB-like AlkP superfamily enzyme